MLLKYEAIMGGEVEILQKFGIIVGFLERVTGREASKRMEEKYSTPRIKFVILILKVHKIENFFDSEFEFYTISLLVMLKY
jgi:hypothetical protein